MGNPMFSNINENVNDNVYTKSNCATYKGITIKTIILLGIAVLSAILSISLAFNGNMTVLLTLLGFSGFFGFMTIIIGRSVPSASAICGVIYAACEGAFLGFISLIGELLYPGVAFAAVISTVVVFVSMLAVFASGIIRNKSKLYSFTLSLGMSLVILFLAMMIFSFIPAFNTLFEHVGVVIIVEALVLVYACAMLLTNFAEAQELVKNGCDKRYEWTCSFGLLISVLYIYIEVLRIALIIAQMFDRN